MSTVYNYLEFLTTIKILGIYYVKSASIAIYGQLVIICLIESVSTKYEFPSSHQLWEIVLESLSFSLCLNK